MVALMATDYSSLSTEELLEMRGSVPAEEQEAFRSEMQSRMQSLSPEERQALRQNRSGDGTGEGYHRYGANRSDDRSYNTEAHQNRHSYRYRQNEENLGDDSFRQRRRGMGGGYGRHR